MQRQHKPIKINIRPREFIDNTNYKQHYKRPTTNQLS